MARKQVLVQLDEALVRDLDRLAGQSGVSRSEVIRRAARGLLRLIDEVEADRRLVESYRQLPQEEWIVAAGEHLLQQLDLGPPPPE